MTKECETCGGRGWIILHGVGTCEVDACFDCNFYSSAPRVADRPSESILKRCWRVFRPRDASDYMMVGTMAALLVGNWWAPAFTLASWMILLAIYLRVSQAPSRVTRLTVTSGGGDTHIIHIEEGQT